jgi:predicted metal-dependent hydrolase
MVKETIIGDMRIQYETIERPVKYPRLEFKTGKLVLILPRGCKDEADILHKKKAWIVKKAKEIESAKRKASHRYASGKSEVSIRELRELVDGLVEKYSEKLGERPNRIFYRTMTFKWGSCSGRRNVSLNTGLRFLPENLIAYIVFHEMAHLVAKRHGKEFWKVVEREFPDYEVMEKELLEYWFLIQEFRRSAPEN